jgi:hypothetical protein
MALLLVRTVNCLVTHRLIFLIPIVPVSSYRSEASMSSLILYSRTGKLFEIFDQKYGLILVYVDVLLFNMLVQSVIQKHLAI